MNLLTIKEMGSRGRIIRHREDIRSRIMHAVLQLSKKSKQALYQIMFGIEHTCCDHKQPPMEALLFVSLIKDVIHMNINYEPNTSLSIQKY